MIFLEQLSKEDQEAWLQVYETAKITLNPLQAVGIADSVLQKELDKRADTVTTINFVTQKTDGEILVCDEDGEYFFDAILIGDEDHVDGKRIAPHILQKWTDYINEHGLVADVDHQTIRDLITRGKDMSYIRTFMKSKVGIAKAVKAYLEDGQVKVRAWIDKRYRNIMKRVNGLSLESIVQYDDKDPNLVIGGDIFGFTLNVNTEPAYAGARVTSEV